MLLNFAFLTNPKRFNNHKISKDEKLDHYHVEHCCAHVV